MSTRLKFLCLNKQKDADNITVTLSPVTDGSKENDKFWESTPCGALDFTTVNEAATAEFEIGEEYYIDITKAVVVK